MTLRCILFDFDGTIAETERHGHRVAYNDAFKELGLDWSWDAELYGELLAVAGGLERLRYFMNRCAPRVPAGMDPDELVRAIHRTKGRAFARLVPMLTFRPGVRRLIREAHDAGVRVAIATTAAVSGVEAFLAQDPGLRSMIALIAAGDAVPNKKPAPDIYVWALDKLGINACDAVALEDSSIGLRSASSAGIATLITPSDYTKLDDFSGAASVLSDLGEATAPATCLQGTEPKNGIVTPAFLSSLLTECVHNDTTTLR